MRIRSITEIASEPYCLAFGHIWVKVEDECLYCKRCGKKSCN